jgi:hypothetical protein
MSNEKQADVIKEQLECMVGYKYKYGGRIHELKSYHILKDTEMVQLQTNIKFFERPFDSVMEFLNKFEPLEETGMQTVDKDVVAVPVMQINSKVIAQLKDVLMENIASVKANKEFIPQATAVKLNVDSIIDLAKIEVSYMEAYVRMNKVK